jgi:hypothetical protein
MNQHYRTENDSFEPEKVFRPEQEGKPLEVTEKLETLGKNQLNQEHFEDLEKRRGLSEETVKQYIRPVNKQVLEELEESFDSDTLVKSGWFKYECQICSQETGPTFNRFEQFEEHINEEHDREDAEKYRDWLYTLIPEKGYLIKYIDTESGKTVYGNIRDRDPEPELNKYCQPHQSHVEARKSYRQGIFPAFDEIGGETLIITEGEFKSLALKEQGWDSIAIAGVSLSQDNLDRLFQISSQYDKVVYVVDDDMGGLLSIPSMTSEMNHRGLKILVQVSKDKDIDDKHAEDFEYELQADKPLNVLMDNLETLQSKEHLISKYGKPEELMELFYQCVQGLKRGKQESEIKNIVDQVNKELGSQYGKNTVISELNNWRKEFERKKRKQETEEESTSEVQEFQSTIEIDGKEINLNPVDQLYVREHVETATEILQNDKGVVKPDKKFKIYNISFDKGQEEQEYSLFIPPNRKLNLGDKYLPLKMADLDKQEYNEWIRKQHNEAVRDGYEGSLEDFKDDNFKGQTFEIAGHLNSDSVKKLKELDNQVIKEKILERYLNNGFNYDEDLRKLNHPKILTHDKTVVDPEDVMTHNPHSAYITGTKVGKSFNSGRVGTVRSRVSASGLLGYASADDIREGTLDGMTEPFFADEIRHGSEENIGDNLLNILEKGKAPMSKGQKDMKPEFYGSFTYMSNPQSQEDNKDQIDYFLDFIQKIGNNAQATGSRLGVLLLDLGELEKASGKPLSKEERDKLGTVVEWIKQEISTEYSKIELELQGWLNQEYPESYIEQVKDMREKVFSEKTGEFLEGHKDSYRHARGQALRMAVYDKIGDVLNQHYSIEEIQSLAEDKFQEVMEINLRSISNLASQLGDEERIVARKEALLEAEENLYLKLFVKTVATQYRINPEVLKSIEPVDTFKPVFKDLREELDSVEKGDRYWKWSRVTERIESNISRINEMLEDRYGLTVTEDHDTLFVKGSDFKTFRHFEKLSEDSLPQIDIGDKHDKSDIGKSIENDTPPPSNKGDSEENGENQEGGVEKKRENSMSQMSQMSRNQESSVIVKSQDIDEIKEGLEESEVKAILKVLQEHQPLKRPKVQNHLDEPIEDVNSKVSDLKKLGLLEYDSTTHQFSLTDEGKGKIQNENLESVF